MIVNGWPSHLHAFHVGPVLGVAELFVEPVENHFCPSLKKFAASLKKYFYLNLFGAIVLDFLQSKAISVVNRDSFVVLRPKSLRHWCAFQNVLRYRASRPSQQFGRYEAKRLGR